MHQTLPAVRHEVRLRLAPAAQRRRPLLGPAHVEHVLAHLDHRAVHDPGDDRRHLTGRHRHHHLVELGRHRAPAPHRARAPAPGRDGRTPSGPRRRSGHRSPDASVNSARALPVSPANRWPSADRKQQQAALHAIVVAVVEQVLSARQPAASRCHLPTLEQAEAEPERAPGRPPRIALAQALVVGSLARGRPDVVLAGEVRRHRQPLQIVDTQRRSPVGGRQLDVRIPPRPTLERAPARDPAARSPLPSISHRGRRRHQVRSGSHGAAADRGCRLAIGKVAVGSPAGPRSP